jgi:hypothetical protein
MAAEPYLVFSQRIDSTRQNFGATGGRALPAIFGLGQYDYITNQMAQMRFRVRCGERVAADEYCFDDLLSQVTAPFQNLANTFGARPFGAAS